MDTNNVVQAVDTNLCDPRNRGKNPLAGRHRELLDQLHKTYLQKNTAYGDSFHNTYEDLGLISAITRISDKYYRIKTLSRNRDVCIGDEAITDTLLDLANYCIMTVMEIERKNH